MKTSFNYISINALKLRESSIEVVKALPVTFWFSLPITSTEISHTILTAYLNGKRRTIGQFYISRIKKLSCLS